MKPEKADLQKEDGVIPAARLSRRRFMTVGAALGAAAMQGCNSFPDERILPYVARPPEVIPGVGQNYATSTTRAGYGVGLLVQSHTGRPTKIEGHPEHPASLGRTLVQEQAELLALYDPDRAKGVRRKAQAATWREFVATHRAMPPGPRSVFLLQPSASPLLGSLLQRLRDSRKNCEIYFEPSCAPIARWKGAQAYLGEVVESQYRFERAKVVVALDANFLAGMPMSIRWANDFASTRDVHDPADETSRLYIVESAMTVTGATADCRLAVPGSDVGNIAAALLYSLAQQDPASRLLAFTGQTRRFSEALTEAENRWLDALARDLIRYRGASIVIVGEHQPESVHVLGMLLNDVLGNIGQTVSYTASAMPMAGSDAYSLDRCLQSLDTGDVGTLFMLGGNPAYSLPPDYKFRECAAKASERVYLSAYENETASFSDWFIPATHFLESWGDERAYDGTYSIRQPLIRPLYGGRSVEEVLAALADVGHEDTHRLLRDTFKGSDDDFINAVKRGLIPYSHFPEKPVTPRATAIAEALGKIVPRSANRQLEVDFLHDPRIEDGRLSNNPWLLELPEPISKLVWDNAALVSPETAAALGVARGDIVELRHGQQAVRVPILESPGQARGTIGLWLGWGRQGAERCARDVGVNVNPLRIAQSPWFTPNIEVRKTARKHELVTTQSTLSMHGREIALHRTHREWQLAPDFAHALREKPFSIHPDKNEAVPQWGMTIDLNRCTGCSTCVVACQAENNIPTVGKDMVAMGREMHWLRIDVYHSEQPDDPAVVFQPMLCQHCEKAPCEYVCPVNATVHSSDGLNQMVYNRCVGTRFCSNNCPYKVRRFNYYDYNQDPPEVRRMAFNPDVTVRARGVMEKCSYCVQRIRREQIDAKLEGRALSGHDVVTACQQACPTDAIVFGALSDPTSRVAKNSENPRAYAVLNELGTRPRTRYLARILNDNQETRR